MKIKLLPAESIEQKTIARVKIIRNPSRSDNADAVYLFFFSLFSLLARRSLPFPQFMCLFLPASLPPSVRRVAPANGQHSQDAFYSSSVRKSWH